MQSMHSSYNIRYTIVSSLIYHHQALNEDSLAYQNAISERLGTFVRNMTTFVAGLIVGELVFKRTTYSDILKHVHSSFDVCLPALVRGWEMALVIVAMMPLLVGVGVAVSLATARLQVRQQRYKIYIYNSFNPTICV
jgi:hypothetical protein